MSRRQPCAVHGAKRRLSTIKSVKKRPAGKALQGGQMGAMCAGRLLRSSFTLDAG